MNKFKFEGTDIWFGYSEDQNLERAIAKARVLAEAHPDAKIIYDNDRSITTDSISGSSDATTTEESTLPTSSKKTKVRKETFELPDLHGNVDNGSDVDPLLGI